MTKYTWYRIAGSEAEIAFESNNIAVIEANAKTICLAKHDEKLFAFAHKCPHAGGIMADGWIDGRGNIVCPIHGYRFSIVNGTNTSGEGYKLKLWPVEKRDDGIYVGMEEGLLSWLR